VTRPVRAKVAHGAPQGAATVELRVHLRRGRRGTRRLRTGAESASSPPEPGNVPRISRLMALAIRFDGLVRSGAVRDYAELARLGHVSRARVSQIMNLLLLAPDIQEAILFLPRTVRGKDPVTERQVRGLAGIPSWAEQRRQCPILGHQGPQLFF
jgi:hypothetical protein